MKTTAAKLLTLALLTGMMAACGGGGSGSQEAVAAPPPSPEPIHDDESPADEPDEEPVEQPGDEPIEEPIEEPIDQEGNEPVEPPIEEPVEEQANQPPVVDISFPNPQSLTNQSTITVSGTASDPDGDSISFVSVNGIVAVTNDGFANWQATVPLAFGENNLTVLAVDSEQNSVEAAHPLRVLQQSTFLAQPEGAVVDAQNNELFIADADIPAIVGINLETNERRIVSTNGDSNTVFFSRPNDIGIAPAGACTSLLPSAARCLVVLDNNISTLFVVDADTGERAVLSGGEGGDDIGEGPGFSLQSFHLAVGGPEFCPSFLADRFNNCALVMENFGSVKAVDLATGERVDVLQNDAVAGPDFNLLPSIIADDNSTCNTVLPGTSQCLVAIDRRLEAVVAADLNSGARAVLSGASRGNGPELGVPRALVLVEASHCASVLPGANRCALVGTQNSVVAVDLISGDRAILSSPARGTGPEFSTLNELVFDSANQQVLAVNEAFDSPFVIDSITGDRSLMLDHRLGNGPDLKLTQGLLPLSSAQCEDMVNSGSCGIIIDAENKQLVAVDFTTGDRSLLVAQQDSIGQAFEFISGVIVDEGNSCESLIDGVRHCALVVDFDDNVFAVDLESGARALLSSGPEDVPFTADAPGFIVNNCSSLIADAARCLVKISSGNRTLEAIDLATGSRSVISSDTLGVGPIFSAPISIVPDSNNHCAQLLPGATQCAFVLDSSFSILSEPLVLAVDLQTGDRAIVSDNTRGEGPSILLALSISPASEQFCQSHTPFAACLLLTDAFTGSLMAVDLATGDRSVIFQEVLLRPSAAVVDSSSTDFVFLLDARLHGIVTLNLNSGEGTLSSWSGIVDFR